jgi:alkanesulfonate monooxygenase SsuD/methylene tetrahydromethanopterin reductase-like flavin-dependent oxidoreductase (luciferase family)
MLGQAIQLYRDNFTPSEYLDKPYVSMGVPSIIAESDEEAEYLASTPYLRILSMIRGTRGKLQPPVSNINELWSPAEKQYVDNFYAVAQIGSPETVKKGLNQLLTQFDVDEFIFTCDIYDTEKRLKNFDYLMEIKHQAK